MSQSRNQGRAGAPKPDVAHDGDNFMVVAREDPSIQEEARKIANQWHMSDKGREAVAAALAMRRMRHGLYASAPMICRGEACPISISCPLFQSEMHPEGERCPLEVAAITQFFEKYCEELEVDVDKMVDLGLVRELAEVETQLERVANRLAQEDFIEMVAVGFDKFGHAIYRPAIHKAFEIQERLRNRKDKILAQLHATRAARAKTEGPKAVDPSTRAAELIALAKKIREREQLIIDADSDEVDNDDFNFDEE